MPLDILCLGEAMVEFNQTGGRDSDQYLRGFGGDTSNCAIAAARQGAKAGYCTLVGADPFGDLLLDLWQREGVNIDGVGRRPDDPTAIYFVTHTEKGHAFTYYRRGSAASHMAPADLPMDLLLSAKLLHASGISLAVSPSMRETVMSAIAAMRQAGRQVSFDTNLRLKLWPLEEARLATDAALKLCDIALPSLEDATALTGLNDPRAILDHYREMGIPLVVLKCGAEGVMIADKTGRWRIAGHRVKSVDATGAGDCFDGAFLAEFTRTASALDAAIYANAAAALTTIGYGAVAPIPRRPAVEAFFNSIGRPEPEKL
ncbi:sugar kinase [uncultured Ferrovibrio sp.]|jgi:2-dehydro-3-deoxygluconokinase|uniref:sugar kinase n=1 Tax=uncultured Ferrovibrio sp. TaxID=1576913 RepID=UPI00260427EE|nr:sugar kinase [uncultured Ferrovibrio sp.]